MSSIVKTEGSKVLGISIVSWVVPPTFTDAEKPELSRFQNICSELFYHGCAFMSLKNRSPGSSGRAIDFGIQLLICRCQHIFRQNAISLGRIIYQDMGHCAYQLTVLQYRASAHTLYYTARIILQPIIGYLY